MQKIIINNCFGGFSLSHEGVMTYAKKKKIKLYSYISNSILNEKYKEYISGDDAFCIHYSTKKLNKDGSIANKGYFSDRKIPRDDKDLISVVEELGEKANGSCAKLKIVEIPDGIDWQIEEYDGNEWISEKHQIWS